METRKNLIIVYLGMFMTQFANMVYPMLTLLLSDKLGMSATNISYVLVINFIFLAIASLLGGKIADTCNKKKVIIVFDIISVITYLIGGLIPFSYITMGLIIFAGTCQQLELASYSMLINDIAKEDEKDKAFAHLYMSLNVGMFLSSAISGFLILKHTSLVFFLNAAGVAVSTIVIALLLRYQPRIPLPKSNDNNTAAPRIPVLKIFKNIPILGIYLCMCAVTEAVHNEYAYIIPLEINRILPENNSQIYGTMISSSCLIVILFTTIISNLLHKYSHYAKMRLSNLFQGIGYLVIFIGFATKTVPLLYIGFIIYIFGEIFDSLYYEAYMVEKVPDEYCGTIFGVFSTVLKISVMIADVITGRLYEKNPNNAWDYIAVMVIITLVLTEMIRIKDTKERKIK